MDYSPVLSPRRSRKVVLRWQWILAALLVVGILTYFFQPGFSTWWLRRHLTARALDYGSAVQFTKVEADFFAGRIRLAGIQLRDKSQPANQIRAAEILVDFSPWRLAFQGDRTPITKVTVGKTDAVWKWQAGQQPGSKGGHSQRSFRNLFPESFIGTGISADLTCGTARMVLNNVDFNFLRNAAGEIDIPQFSASLPPWKRNFNNLEGVTAIKDRALYIGGIKLTPDLVLERGALDFTQPDRQKITSDLLFTAFGGQWRTDLDLDRRKFPVEIDLAASFWNLSVNELGNFVGNEQLAEGTIHEGRLTFHGNPADLVKSTTTLRLNATDFRWHERRWDSLVASALLRNRRIEIPKFDLVQAKNQIQLKGNSALPSSWTQLPGEFQLQVLAQIDDLHSAAMLVLPNQNGIEGEAFFAGEVRNQNGRFSGNLKMRGGPLRISGVSVDRARGDLDLQGSEISATNLELVRQSDKATGWATLNLAEPKRYSGEFQMTAVDLKEYAAILPDAVARFAAGGGVKLWWSGDGTAHAHSGAFKMNLRDFLVSRDARAVPVDVESNGSYSPAGITLNHLTLLRPDVRLESAVVIKPESLELRDLHLTGSGHASATGSITLPINLFAAVQTPTLAALLNSRAPAAGQISGSKLRLDELCELAGRRQDIRGRVSFTLRADGPLDDLEAGLDLDLKDFFGPRKLAIPSLKARVQISKNSLVIHSDINAAEGRDGLSADFSAKTILSQTNLIQHRWLDADSNIRGVIQVNRLDVSLLHPWWPSASSYKGDASALLNLAGTAGNPIIAGTITALDGEWQPDWLDFPLQKINGTAVLQDEKLTFDKMIGRYQGGSFTVSGSSGLRSKDDLDLIVQGKLLPLTSAAESSEAMVSGSLHLHGRNNSRKADGVIELQNAVIRRELTITVPPVDLPPISLFTLPWIPADWEINLEVTAAQPVEISGREQKWLVSPEIIFRGTAESPNLLGKMLIQPFTLLKDAFDKSKLTSVYFVNTILENGVVEDGTNDVSRDLAPGPALEYTTTSSPEVNSGFISPRLQIVP